MLTLFRLILIAVSLLISMGSVFAVEMPFIDVQKSALYYDAVRDLYEGKVITDNGDHLFRPNDLMNRDFFVSLSVGIGCHKCETPSIEDISKYQISPFVDLPKTNRYYYCIAYAKDNDIAQGYITNTIGKATCENGKQYMSSPFCAENTITRIEAAAILLRRAKLWDDSLNSGNFDRTNPIPDTTTYWYGYAKKGIEVAILKQKTDGKIGQDEKITRGEFAIMAARTLSYTQCQPDIITNTIESEIGIRNSDNVLIKKSTFLPGELFSLVPIVTSGNWNYNWKAKNLNTGEVVTMSGDKLPSSKISEGTWIIDLQVIDPNTNKIVSEPYATITIGNTKNYHGDIGIRVSNGTLSDKNIFNQNDTITLVSTHTGGPWDQTWKAIDTDTGNIVTGIGKELPGSLLGKGSWNITLITKDPQNGNIVDTDIRNIQIISGVIPPNTNTQNLSVILHADPIVGNLTSTIHFSSTTNTSNGLTYSWNYGDGVITTGGANSDHIYTEKGVYTVIVTVTNPNTGETSQSSIIIRITGDKDTDGDGILDHVDQCPLVYAKTITGCPLIPIFQPTNPVIENTIEAAIGVHNANDVLVKKSSFVIGENFSLIPITTNPGNWNYNWTATNIVTGKVESGNGTKFPGSKFTPGDWKVILNVIDPATGKVVSSPSMTLDVHPAGTIVNTSTDPIPCVSIIPNPQIVTVGGIITITPTVCSSSTQLTYNWNYGDGKNSTDPNTTTHVYTTPGTYTITLKVTDPVTGKTGEATTIITVNPIAPSSNAKTIAVTLVATPGNVNTNTPVTFTPTITQLGTNPLEYSWDYKDGATGSTSGSTTHTYTIPDKKYPVTLTIKDKITGEISTAIATVNTKSTTMITHQPPNTGGVFNNVCLEKYRKSQGLLIGKPNCIACPCANSITIDSTLRSCDVVFPTILSPSLDAIYSRGGFYLIP